jgi:hypothetical protein
MRGRREGWLNRIYSEVLNGNKDNRDGLREVCLVIQDEKIKS